jgi:hypothetical protein
MKNTTRVRIIIAGLLAATAQAACLTTAQAQDQEQFAVVVNDQGADSNTDPTAQTHTGSATVTIDAGGGGGSSQGGSGGGGGGGVSFSTGSSSGTGNIVIDSLEPDSLDPHVKNHAAREVTWLGLSVDESTEALSSQLGLKTGEGLIVNFVSPDSPAVKADFHKNDVLVELDGQMLMDAVQLRKLVQMHAEGDTINVAFFRGGQKQTVAVKLGKRSAGAETDSEDGFMPGGLQKFQFRLDGLNGQLKGMQDSFARAGLDKEKMRVELQRTLDQTRKAIRDSMRNVSTDERSLTDAERQLQKLVHDGMDVDKDATVTVRSGHNSSSTVVKTDDDGSIVFVTGEHQHLTAHDKNGKLLFDGDIDTPAERVKVPKDVMEKIKPLLK